MMNSMFVCLWKKQNKKKRKKTEKMEISDKFEKYLSIYNYNLLIDQLLRRLICNQRKI